MGAVDEGRLRGRGGGGSKPSPSHPKECGQCAVCPRSWRQFSILWPQKAKREAEKWLGMNPYHGHRAQSNCRTYGYEV